METTKMTPLATEALRWYAEQAEAAAKYMATEDKPHALEAILTVLALDGGSRAAAALAPQPALAVKGLDTVAVAHEIAKRIATSGKTGRVHQIVYDAATEGALEALALAAAPATAQGEN